MHCQKSRADRPSDVPRQPTSPSAPFPTGLIIGDILEGIGFQDEETTVNPTLANLGFLGELGNPISIKDQAAEAGRGPYCGGRRQLTVLPVKFDQGVDVDVRHSITICCHKRLAAKDLLSAS